MTLLLFVSEPFAGQGGVSANTYFPHNMELPYIVIDSRGEELIYDEILQRRIVYEPLIEELFVQNCLVVLQQCVLFEGSPVNQFENVSVAGELNIFWHVATLSFSSFEIGKQNLLLGAPWLFSTVSIQHHFEHVEKLEFDFSKILLELKYFLIQRLFIELHVCIWSFAEFVEVR